MASSLGGCIIPCRNVREKRERISIFAYICAFTLEFVICIWRPFTREELYRALTRVYRACYLFVIFLGKIAPLYITRSEILKQLWRLVSLERTRLESHPCKYRLVSYIYSGYYTNISVLPITAGVLERQWHLCR